MRPAIPRDARTAALALAVASVLAVLGVAAVAVGVAVRDEPATPDPYDDWQLVRGDGAVYRAPPGWTLHPAGQRVSYRDRSGRAQARGGALSTYDGNDCGPGGRQPGAWALLAQPVRARDVPAVAVAAARQWARGFGTGERGTGRLSEPEARPRTLADGTAAVSVAVEVDLRGSGNPCGAIRGELTVVARRDGDLVRLLVVARHEGAVPDAVYAGVAGSLARQLD